MIETKKRDVTILGAGLVGSVLAVLLLKKGHKVTIYERRTDMRLDAANAGRSINLAMSNRGWKALELAGLREEIEEIALPMNGRELHQPDGSQVYQQYGKNNEAIYSVSRGELNKKLMNLAEEHGATIKFDHHITGVDIKNNIIKYEPNLALAEEHQCDLLFGADGAFSALRTAATYQDRTNYSQYYVDSGYKELNIPAGPGCTWLLKKDALHIWPRGSYMMIALPNTDGSFTCTLFMPFEGKNSFESIKTDRDVTEFFEQNFPDALPMMPTIHADFSNNPTASLITTKIFPWAHKDQSIIIGDAAHAIVPFYGQGMNAGFEDCTVLHALMEEKGNDWSAIFSDFEQRRKPNADAVAELALTNFIEMRDKVADPIFLERKKIEKELGLMYPKVFNSVYEMVSFSHTPYAYAMDSIKVQDWLLEKIMGDGKFFAKKDEAEYRKQLDTWMKEYEQREAAIPAYQ